MSTNMMQDAAAWHGGLQQNAGGREVTYRRGDLEVTLTATPQHHEETITVEGVPTEIRVYSWTIARAELILDGSEVDPVEMDRIEETLHGVETVWEVQPYDEGRPCFEWADAAKTLLLVHTKQVAAAA